MEMAGEKNANTAKEVVTRRHVKGRGETRGTRNDIIVNIMNIEYENIVFGNFFIVCVCSCVLGTEVFSSYFMEEVHMVSEWSNSCQIIYIYK